MSLPPRMSRTGSHCRGAAAAAINRAAASRRRVVVIAMGFGSFGAVAGWASAHAASAVDVNRLPSDESAVFAGKECHSRRHLRRIARASERHDGGSLLDDTLQTRW